MKEDERFAKMIAEAPDELQSDHEPSPINLYPDTGFPKRYQTEWPQPNDAQWHDRREAVIDVMTAGGILCLTGNRGTGKTRLAAEVARSRWNTTCRYTTAMGLFLRIRGTYGNRGGETESRIIEELTKTWLLVIDEIQERGNSEWEDRLLTHIIDVRYGNMKPTILIGNLTRQALITQLGDSIASRIAETGGFMELIGKSFRNQSK